MQAGVVASELSHVTQMGAERLPLAGTFGQTLAIFVLSGMRVILHRELSLSKRTWGISCRNRIRAYLEMRGWAEQRVLGARYLGRFMRHTLQQGVGHLQGYTLIFFRIAHIFENARQGGGREPVCRPGVKSEGLQFRKTEFPEKRSCNHSEYEERRSFFQRTLWRSLSPLPLRAPAPLREIPSSASAFGSRAGEDLSFETDRIVCATLQQRAGDGAHAD